MSSISEKYGAVQQAVQQQAQMQMQMGGGPAWVSDPNGIPFSRRSTPDLYSSWLATSQESPGALMEIMNRSKTVPQRLKDVFAINMAPQHKRDGLLAAIYPNEAADIQADKNVNILKARMKCYPDDAHNPIVTNMESARREHIIYYHSRNQRDEHNERQLLADSINKTKTEGEVRHTFMEEPKKPGLIGRIFRGGR